MNITKVKLNQPLGQMLFSLVIVVIFLNKKNLTKPTYFYMYKIDLVHFIVLLIFMFNFIIHIMSAETIII